MQKAAKFLEDVKANVKDSWVIFKGNGNENKSFRNFSQSNGKQENQSFLSKTKLPHSI
jgi:hypothetical protein